MKIVISLFIKVRILKIMRGNYLYHISITCVTACPLKIVKSVLSKNVVYMALGVYYVLYLFIVSCYAVFMSSSPVWTGRIWVFVLNCMLSKIYVIVWCFLYICVYHFEIEPFSIHISIIFVRALIWFLIGYPFSFKGVVPPFEHFSLLSSWSNWPFRPFLYSDWS